MSQADEAIGFARQQIGKPYVFGTKGPNTYDCSGLIVAAYAQTNPPINLPHWTGALIGCGIEVSKGDLQPGDMVFPNIDHVQLYVGDGQVIEAPQAGLNVRLIPMGTFWRGRRVVNDGKKGTALSAWVGSFAASKDDPSLLDAGKAYAKLAANLTNPKFWVRVGKGALGGVLIFFGVLMWMRRPIGSTVSSVYDGIKSVGNTAVQGATFGFGAGFGGLGAPTGSADRMVHQATAGNTRRIPQAPASAVPVTAQLPRELEPPTPARGQAMQRVTALRRDSRVYRRVRWADEDPGYVGSHRAVGRASRPSQPLPKTQARESKGRQGG